MASIPIYCTHCGAISDGAGGIHIEGSSRITLIGNTTTCPRCGRPAKFVDGVFNERGNGLEIVSAPPITHAVIDRLRQIAEQARQGEITPEQAIEQVNQIDPRVGTLLERVLLLGLGAFTAFLTFLMYQTQLDQLDLQKSDSQSSGQFQERVIDLLERQVSALEQENDPKGVKPQRRAPAAEKANGKSPAVKRPSKRRSDVQKARKKALLERRMAFCPRPQR